MHIGNLKCSGLKSQPVEKTLLKNLVLYQWSLTGLWFYFLLLKFSLHYNLGVKQSIYKAKYGDYMLLGHWNIKTVS